VSEVIHDLLGYTGIKIIQRPEMFAFSLDSILLADFVHIYAKTKKIMDFGTGNAPIPLFLSLKTDAPIIGIEIQDEVYDMASRSVTLNHLEKQIEIIHGNILDVHKIFVPSSFDIVTCNPPFFKVTTESNINKNDYLTHARHEVLITLEDILIQSKRMLKNNGELNIVHRIDRLEEIFVLLHKHHFAVKRLKFVYPKPGKPANTVLIEAKNNGSSGSLKMLEPLYIYQEDGSYTEDVLKIFRFGKK
jgi:tRNA1(Val) A37 N6-methylase TrmN6